MKFRRTITNIDLNDPANAELKAVKEQTDKTLEWAKMYHQGSVFLLIVSLIVAIFGSFEEWLYILSLYLIVAGLSLFLVTRARKRLMKAINEALDDEQ